MKRRDVTSAAASSRLAGQQDLGTSSTKSRDGSPLSPSLFRWTGFLLHRVQLLAQTFYATDVANIGLRPNQIGILQLLASEGSMVQARLGEKLGIDKATIVPSVNDLERQRFVRRTNHVEDGRAFIVELTAEGRKKLAIAEQLNADVSGRLFEPLSPAEQSELHRLLRIVAEFHLVNRVDKQPKGKKAADSTVNRNE